MKYLKDLFLSKIQNIDDSQDDVDRLYLEEVIDAYNNLKSQVLDAEELFDDDRDELIQLIETKIRLAPDKEKQILQEEAEYAAKKEAAISRAKERFFSLNPIRRLANPLPEDFDFMTLKEIDSLYATEKGIDDDNQR